MSEESHLPKDSPGSSLDPSSFDIPAEWVQEDARASQELVIDHNLAATDISSVDDENPSEEAQAQELDAQLDHSAEKDSENLTFPKEAPSSTTDPTSIVNNAVVSERGGEATTSLGEGINFNVSGALTSIQDSLDTTDADRSRLNDHPFDAITGTSYYADRGTDSDMSCSPLARELLKKNAIRRASTNIVVEETKEIDEEMLRKYIVSLAELIHLNNLTDFQVCVRPLTPKEQTMADIKAELNWQHVWMGENLASKDGLT